MTIRIRIVAVTVLAIALAFVTLGIDVRAQDLPVDSDTPSLNDEPLENTSSTHDKASIPSRTMTVNADAAKRVLLDRVVVRFDSSELGGPSRPRYIFERQLAFEARIEALVEGQRTGIRLQSDYTERDVRTALERHVIEEILANMPIYPNPTTEEVRQRSIATMVSLQNELGGRKNLLDAAFLEGMEDEDINAYVLRRARASLYLDRMVAPMLNPTRAELLEVLRTQTTPFKGKQFDDVEQQLRNWYIADRLNTALSAYFRSARARIRITVIAR